MSGCDTATGAATGAATGTARAGTPESGGTTGGEASCSRVVAGGAPEYTDRVAVAVATDVAAAGAAVGTVAAAEADGRAGADRMAGAAGTVGGLVGAPAAGEAERGAPRACTVASLSHHRGKAMAVGGLSSDCRGLHAAA